MTAASNFRSSSGHVLSSPDWLDVHFEACRAEYAAMLDEAGFEAGMAVLDAGSGSGSFLPLIRERVGVEGKVVALDTATENMTHVAVHLTGVAEAVAAASVTAVPFRAASFDAVWCANTLQFLDDGEVGHALADFARVVKPGGIVAIKDVDMTGFKLAPAPPLLAAHLAETCITGADVKKESHGSLRGRELRALMQRAGFVDMRQRSFLIERWGPLGEEDARFWSDWLPYLAELAARRGVPAEDMETWRQVMTPELARRFVSRPDFYGCELQVVCTGRVPGGVS